MHTCVVKLLACLMMLCLCGISFDCHAQKDKKKKDQKELKKEKVQKVERFDTLEIYRKIKKIAYKRRWTKELYKAVFVDPAPIKYVEKKQPPKVKEEDPNRKFEGKVIRSISIEVYDPFGYSVNDTLQRNTSGLQRLGNNYHVTTRKRIIRNLLLLRPGDGVEYIKLTESERLIRATGYVGDARIYLKETSSPDSVDVRVVVQDKWTLDAPFTIATNSTKLTVRDRNFFGLGQRLEQSARYRTNGEYELGGRYSISNISKTFITSDVFYNKVPGRLNTGISLDRPFYSALASWAGGVYVARTWNTYLFTDTIEDINRRMDLDYFNTDMWLAKIIHLKVGNKQNRRVTNLVLSGRYANLRFQQRPSHEIDVGNLNANTTLYLGAVGFSVSKYYKDQFIYRFGANEDIPEGFIAQLLYGISLREYRGMRHYIGFDIGRGKHYKKLGYLSVNLTYGNYYNKGMRSNSTINLGITYFTNLISSGKWYVRQFVTARYVGGFNKEVYERVTLRTDELYGFNSGSADGTSKWVVDLESVCYAPYNFLGFRFAPVFLFGFGMLEDANYGLFHGRVYQSYAVGFLFRNENLLTNTFRVTFGFSSTAEEGTKSAKFLPRLSLSVRFRSFGLGKPDVVGYF